MVRRLQTVRQREESWRSQAARGRTGVAPPSSRGEGTSSRRRVTSQASVPATQQTRGTKRKGPETRTTGIRIRETPVVDEESFDEPPSELKRRRVHIEIPKNRPLHVPIEDLDSYLPRSVYRSANVPFILDHIPLDEPEPEPELPWATYQDKGPSTSVLPEIPTNELQSPPSPQPPKPQEIPKPQGASLFSTPYSQDQFEAWSDPMGIPSQETAAAQTQSAGGRLAEDVCWDTDDSEEGDVSSRPSPQPTAAKSSSESYRWTSDEDDSTPLAALFKATSSSQPAPSSPQPPPAIQAASTPASPVHSDHSAHSSHSSESMGAIPESVKKFNSQLFENKQCFAKYQKQLSKSLLTGARVDLNTLFEWRFPELISFQHWDHFMTLDKTSHHLPIRCFYANLAQQPNGSLTTYFKGSKICFDEEDLAVVTLAPYRGVNVFGQTLSTFSYPEGHSLARAIELLYETRPANPDHPSGTGLRPAAKFMANLLGRSIIQKGGSRNAYRGCHKLLTYCVLARIPVNLPRLIMDIMWSIQFKKSVLGFGKVISALFDLHDIDLSSCSVLKPDTTFNSSNANRMGLRPPPPPDSPEPAPQAPTPVPAADPTPSSSSRPVPTKPSTVLPDSPPSPQVIRKKRQPAARRRTFFPTLREPSPPPPPAETTEEIPPSPERRPSPVIDVCSPSDAPISKDVSTQTSGPSTIPGDFIPSSSVIPPSRESCLPENDHPPSYPVLTTTPTTAVPIPQPSQPSSSSRAHSVDPNNRVMINQIIEKVTERVMTRVSDHLVKELYPRLVRSLTQLLQNQFFTPPAPRAMTAPLVPGLRTMPSMPPPSAPISRTRSPVPSPAAPLTTPRTQSWAASAPQPSVSFLRSSLSPARPSTSATPPAVRRPPPI